MVEQNALGRLSAISTGYAFKSRIEPVVPPETGNVLAVQLRNIESDGSLNVDVAVMIHLDYVEPRYCLQPGDVVFCSRGVSLKAALVPESIGYAVAAAPVFIIRLKPKALDPGYLVWFLNQPSLGQRQLMAVRRGSNMPMVSIKGLSSIEILLPPLATQAKIAELYALQRQENKLLKQIQERRNQYMDAVLKKCMQEALV